MADEKAPPPENQIKNYLESTGDLTADAEQAILAEAEHEIALEEKYGDSALRAGAEGVARGLTLGLSDQVLSRGVDAQEGLREREERNPVSAGLGEVAGNVAPILASGGGSALAKGAVVAGAPMMGAVKVGRMVESATAKILAETAASTSRKKLLAQIVAKSAPEVLGGAAEGALYGAGHEISEDALGRADLNAENILASMGAGAALGGGVNAALSAVKSTVPVVGKVFKPVSDRIKKASEKYVNPAQAAEELLDFSTAQKVKIKKSNPTFFDELPDWLATRTNAKRFGSMDELAADISKVKNTSGRRIGEIADQLDAMSQAEGVKLPPRAVIYDDILKTIDDKRKFLLASPEVNKAELRILNDFERDLTRKGIQNDSVTYKELNDLRKNYDKKAKYNQFGSPADNFKSEIANDLRWQLRSKTDELADLLSATSKDDLAKKLSQELKLVNKDYHVSSAIEKNAATAAEKSNKGISFSKMIQAGVFGFGGGPVGLAILGAKELLESDIRRRFVIFTNIQKQANAIQSRIKDATGAFFDKASKVSKPTSLRILTDSWLSTDSDTGKAPKDRKTAFNNVSKNIVSLSANPEALIDRLAISTAPISKYAPNTSQQMHDKLITAVAFLQSKLPKGNEGIAKELFKRQYEPSGIELAKFERYMQIVEAPMSALEDLEAGTLTRDHVEALKAVYPALYNEIQTKVTERLSEHPEDLSYSKRVQLGILMDLPTDESLEPYAIAGLQMNFGPQPTTGQQEANSAVKPTQKGVASINMAERATPALAKVRTDA